MAKTVETQSMEPVLFTVDSSIPKEEFTHIGSDILGGEDIVRKSLSYWQDAKNRLFLQTSAKVIFTILLIIAIGSILIPVFSPMSISEQHLDHTNISMFNNEAGHLHIFGTDSLGRDIWVRIWYGARISLTIAITAIGINCAVGIVYGGISGYFGGRLDNFMMRFVEIINGIPYLLVVILLRIVLPGGIVSIIIAYSLVGWIGMARLVRGQVIQLKEQEFVVAAKTMGASSSRIIARHMIPNLLSVIIVNLTLSIPNAIFTEAFLSFIGLGVPIPEASLGTLANDGISNLRSYPFQLFIPAIFMSVTMLSFNLIGDKLRDAFDPKLRR
ncbi:MAG: ABC transporter permease [Breznakia sp.]